MIFPGSEIIGVPASDIIEIIFSDFINSIILLTFFISLNLWFEINLDLILYLSNIFFDTLVSSQRMNSDCFKISIALKVISPKLPIGVETTYNPKLYLFFFMSESGIMELLSL